MTLGMIMEEEFQEKRDEWRDNNIPLIISQRANWRRVAQLGEAQSLG